MLKTMIKLSLYSVKDRITKVGRGKKAKSGAAKVGMLILFAFLYLYMGVSIGFTFYAIYEPLNALGKQDFYFMCVFLMSTVLCLVSGLFTTYSQIFNANDNELLLSMPIKPKHILIGRVMSVLLLNYMFELMIVLPSFVVHLIFGSTSVLQVLTVIVDFLLLPLPAIAVSFVIGFLFNLITRRIRNKSILVTVFSIAFLVAYIYYIPQIGTIGKYVLNHTDTISDTVRNYIPLAYYYGDSIANSNLISLLLYAFISIVSFAVIYILMSALFLKTIGTVRGYKSKKYVSKPLKQSSVMWALIKRELKRFVSIASYMVNSAIGIVFTVIIPIAVFVKQSDIRVALNILADQLPGDFYINEFIAAIFIILLCLMSSADTISAPSISLEGKTIWLLHSLPVNGYSILMSKVYTHVIICLPASLIAGTIFNILFPSNLLLGIFMYITPTVMTFVQAFLGVWSNMHFPRTDYINETAAVKQSLSVVITMFGSMFIVGVPTAVYILLLSELFGYQIFILLFTAYLALIAGAFYLYILKRGNKVFANID
ncbi:MAG: putative ABC exporter domain-containing protein [Clostridiales bacterium]|nr:putative ABC exporter domain-containing protein [Clostridiales bacterium]